MDILSLGYRTDFWFLEFEGRVVEREGYLCARIPSDPDFYWGNLLLFPHAPGPGDFERWTSHFRQEFADEPRVTHMTFAWDSTDAEEGDLTAFKAAGFEIERSVVLAAREVVPPPKFHAGIEVRPLLTDDEWEEALRLQVACRAPHFEESSYERHKRARMNSYRKMSDAGLGHWFGAFLEGRQIADLGIFVKDGIGRFQSIETHPDFRRLGICGALVYQTARMALETMGAERLVMVADPHYYAARIYQSVGFQETERMIGAYNWKRAH